MEYNLFIVCLTMHYCIMYSML